MQTAAVARDNGGGYGVEFVVCHRRQQKRIVCKPQRHARHIARERILISANAAEGAQHRNRRRQMRLRAADAVCRQTQRLRDGDCEHITVAAARRQSRRQQNARAHRRAQT